MNDNISPQEPQKKDNRSRTLLLVIIGVLLVINGILIYNLLNKNKQLTLTEEQVTNSEKEIQELDSSVKAYEAELGAYKGKNAQLDSAIAVKEQEIQEKAEKIRQLLKSGKISQAQLRDARGEIGMLKETIAKYQSQIDELAKENQVLKDEIVKATESNQTLTEENKRLGQQVTVAQKLKATDINVEGLKVRSSGKEIETTRAGRLDKVKVTFNVVENEVAEKGPRDIYLKITGPDGTTMSGGTETFTFEGKESLYSGKETVNYENARTPVTITWSKSTDWAKGKYLIEVYTEGYMIGSKELVLR